MYQRALSVIDDKAGTSYGQTQTFSECYETSDMNSSFGSERDRWREVKREEARAKFNDAQILRFEDMFSHLHQPKLEKKKKKNIVWKEKVIYYNYLIIIYYNYLLIYIKNLLIFKI